MCSNCRDRFGLPVVSNGHCEVCWTLQRLNRVILTRHPSSQTDILRLLLRRTVAKVEAFVEEHEVLEALGRSQLGNIGVRPAAGLIPVKEEGREEEPGCKPKSAAAPVKAPVEEEEDKAVAESSEEKEPEKDEKEEAKASRKSRSPDQLRERSKEKKKRKRSEKKDRSKKDHSEGRKEKKRRRKEHQKEKAKEEEDLSDQTPVRDDVESPENRRRDESGKKEKEPRSRLPRSPSKSPPGVLQRPAGAHHSWKKPKKDKGYNHYVRGRERGYAPPSRREPGRRWNYPSSRW